MADYSSVNYNHEPVGTITLLSGDRVLFSFNDIYINDPARDTMSLSFKDQYGDLIADIRPTQTRVMPFFANLLPEGSMRDRGGSVCLNRIGAYLKWVSALVTLRPGPVTAY